MHTLSSFSEIDFLTALETGYPRSRFPQGLVSDENPSFGFQMVAFLLWTQREKEQKAAWREQRRGQKDDPFTKLEFKFL